MHQRLFLTSVGLSALPKFVIKPLNTLKVAFIPTAADPYGDKWFVEEDRKKLHELGLNFFELDIKDTYKESLAKELEGVDLIYISGGNSFYLLEKIKQSGFDEIVKKLINRGVIYVGASAGAVVVCPTIEPIQLLDDPSEAPSLTSYRALGLVDYVILPHYGKEKYSEKYQDIMDSYKNKGYKLIPLTDDQAIIVNGIQYHIVTSK